jgi:glutathione S-transferase
MFRLYQFATSPFCAKVRKILDYKGLDYETVEVDYLERKELLVASGQLMVPALTFDSGETLIDSEAIAMALEERYPEPTIFPAGWRGAHLGLARYFDTELEDALFRAALPFELRHYARQGRDREAFYRLIRERKYGLGFCDQMIRDHAMYRERACQMLAPLDEAFTDRAFLLGRIGYADFALYGQMTYLTLGDELALPEALAGLHAFHDRMDRMTSRLDPNS